MKKMRDFFETITILSRPQGASYNDIADLLECSRRTAIREVEYIKTMFNLEERFNPNGYEKLFYLTEDNIRKYTSLKMPNLNLSASETTALMLLRGKSKLFQDSVYEQHLKRAFNKIFTIDDYKLDQFQNLTNIILLGETKNKNYEEKESIINELVLAMELKKTCRITYHSYYYNSKKTYNINPLHLFQRDGGLYFFTTINDYKDIRNLAVERVLNIEILDKDFQIPSNFDPNDYLETTFNLEFGEPDEYKILFSSKQELYISERKWAKEQKIEKQEDGKILLWLKTSGRDDIKSWVMSYGTDAELLEPKSLRKEIAEELEQLTNVYKS